MSFPAWRYSILHLLNFMLPPFCSAKESREDKAGHNVFLKHIYSIRLCDLGCIHSHKKKIHLQN